MSLYNVIFILALTTLLYLLINAYYQKSPSEQFVDAIMEGLVSGDIDNEPQIRMVPVDMGNDNDTYSSDSSSSWTSRSRSSMNNNNDPIENFRANGINNPVIDQGTWDNAYALLSPPYTGGGKDSLSHRQIVNQVPNKEFLDLITVIKAQIADKLISYATTCKEMHGHESKPRLGDGKRTLTLECVSDPYALQDELIKDTYNLIYDYIKDKFNINLNAYSVHHDLHMHMNLMEGLIYPLQYSGLYTVHGVQYTTADWIRNKVQNDIDVRNILMTVFSRRNIEIEVDTDQILH